MTVALRGVGQDSDVLIRQLDSRLARLRAGTGGQSTTDLETAELVAAELRRLVTQTTQSCAADRARVRAAVRYFLGRPGRERRPQALAENVRVINEIIGDLGRSVS